MVIRVLALALFAAVPRNGGVDDGDLVFIEVDATERASSTVWSLFPAFLIGDPFGYPLLRTRLASWSLTDLRRPPLSPSSFWTLSLSPSFCTLSLCFWSVSWSFSLCWTWSLTSSSLTCWASCTGDQSGGSGRSGYDGWSLTLSSSPSFSWFPDLCLRCVVPTLLFWG